MYYKEYCFLKVLGIYPGKMVANLLVLFKICYNHKRKAKYD